MRVISASALLLLAACSGENGSEDAATGTAEAVVTEGDLENRIAQLEQAATDQATRIRDLETRLAQAETRAREAEYAIEDIEDWVY